ncbi:FAD-binding oxidoreductase [Aspergillus mulundensis]|uniref:D-lactate dehydrogenase (cytochrome) n=1 Tax=Aspergillus mulundensis TaxID=1810919 RepID=A0A3D8RXX6_9EURO|nr:Uncharacterized protein DSM5745_05765 [Aspergillus mulundensis]RDW78913.1 Uncharacterized protein DSM5745_05765 [Aspergillus mulundensis]
MSGPSRFSRLYRIVSLRRGTVHKISSVVPARGLSDSIEPSQNRLRLSILLSSAAVVSFGMGYFMQQIDDSSSAYECPALRTIQYPEREVMLKAAQEISQLLGDDSVSFDEDDIEAHGHSDWSTSNSPGRAVAVVYPKSTEEVSRAAAICYKHNVPIVPYGAGSSVEGNASSPYSGIVINLAQMDRIVAFHPEDMDVVVQPGVNWVDLNNEIKHENLFLPLDPSPTATIGGMVSTNCSGTNAFRYGTMKDWVVNVTAVLADGRVIKTRRRPRKTSAGYNLTSLFVGAEGTLGIVTEITLKLAVIPKETSVAVVSFPTINQAASAASKIIRSGIQLAAMELMDDVQMRVVNQHGSAEVRAMNWDETPALFLKFAAPSKETIAADVVRVERLVQSFEPSRYVFATNNEEEARIWAARKEALWTMISIKPEGHAIWSTDVAVPISRLAKIIERSKQDAEHLGVFSSVVGHVGDGNFHEAIMYDPRDPAMQHAVEEVAHRMMDRALEMEGTVTGEHAIGIGKMEGLLAEVGTETVEVMKIIKQALDPKWIMNPGKVFDLPTVR